MNQDKWFKIIADWERSGLAQAKFCEVNNLSYKEFKYWRTKGIKSGKYERRWNQALSANHNKSTPAFSKLALSPEIKSPFSPTAPASDKPQIAIEINLPNGINLRIPVC